MKTFTLENTKVTLYTNVEEYIKDFYDPPEGAVLDTNNLPETAGFACIETNEIWIYKSETCNFEELLSTVAHELGHLIEGGYKKNPPQKRRYDKKHELKAIHYEDFALKAYRIATTLFKEPFS